jgi:putative FmdB family regulatory protein
MPVYVYRNLRTGERFEVEQRISEPALTEHPESGDPVKRLVQPVGIAFKGSGFYVTDSRKGATGNTSKSKASGEEKSGDNRDGKSEAKSESKAESSSSSVTESSSKAKD